MVAGTGGVNGAGALLVTLPLAVQGAMAVPACGPARTMRCGKSGTGLLPVRTGPPSAGCRCHWAAHHEIFYATINGTIESGA